MLFFCMFVPYPYIVYFAPDKVSVKEFYHHHHHHYYYYVQFGRSLQRPVFSPWDILMIFIGCINNQRIRSRTGARGHRRSPRVRGASNSRNADRFPAIFGRFRRFFVKLAHKTTSVSGFLFSFNLNVVDYIENDRHIDIVSWRIFEIPGAKVLFLAVFLRFFVKMAAKSISVSGFHLRFGFLVLDFISHDIHIDGVCRGLFEI